jgi:hypothetical protein
MHTLEFDAQTELSINQLAMLSGKTPDDLLHDMVINSIKSHNFQMASSSKSRESTASANWDAFFEKLSHLKAKRTSQQGKDRSDTDAISPRDEIYADRLR